MKNFLRTAAIALVALFSVFSARADDFAYAVLQNSSFGSIDLTTGVFSPLGISNTGTAPIGLGLAGGTFYTTDYHSVGTLYSINPTNGSLTSIGSSGVSYDLLGSTASGLYAVANDGGANLYSINRTTGAATLIGSTGLSLGGFRTLSTNNGGNLYAAVGSNFYSLNTTTGAATLVGNSGTSFGGLVMENGTLYGALSQVYTINPGTGAATAGPTVTGNGGSVVFGLAPIPEPATWALFGGGIVLLLCLRRRSVVRD